MQEGACGEAREIQRRQEMLAYRPTNLEVGLTSDKARVTKVRRPQLHVLKGIKRIFRVLAPEPYPVESSGYVLNGMEDNLRLHVQYVCHPINPNFGPK